MAPSKYAQYFNKIDSSTNRCKICLKNVKGTNTSNMKSHVQKWHTNIFKNIEKQARIVYEDFNDDDSDISQVQDQVQSLPQAQEHPQAPCNGTSITKTQWPIRDNRNTNLSSQPTIVQSIKNIEEFKEGGIRHSNVTDTILYMIAKDNMPLNAIEKPGLLKLLKVTVPLYKPPKRKHLTKLMDQKFEAMVVIVKIQLKKIKCMSLTADIWTDSHTTTSYLGITAHYIDQSRLHSITLGLAALDKSHTASYISEKFEDTLNFWEISKDTIIAVITDHANNMVRAVKDSFGHDKALQCYAHCLNLLVEQALEDSPNISVIINKVKKIVTYSKQSVKATDVIKEIQKSNGKTESTILKLIQSCPTRWNSIFFMLERFLVLSETISRALLRLENSPTMLTRPELSVISEAITLLRPFELATKEFSYESHVTASKIIPLRTMLSKKMYDIKCSTDEGKQLQERLKIEFAKRFHNVEKNKILATCTIMDPRFKRMHFSGPLNAANAVSEVQDQIKKIANEPVSEDPIINVTTLQNTHSLWGEHDMEVSAQASTSSSNSDENVLTGLKLYLITNVENRSSSPIEYWESSSYPGLSQVAKKYCCVLASSVPSERLFSKVGNILTDCRSRLLSKRLFQLTFLSSIPDEYWNKIN